MAIRSVPLVVAAAEQADQARLARGQRRSVTALVVPTVVRSVRIADALGDALVARGVGEESVVADGKRVEDAGG
jgi:biotin transport system permease protein